MTRIFEGTDWHILRQISDLFDGLDLRVSVLEGGSKVLDRQVGDVTVANTAAQSTVYTFPVNHDDVNGHILRMVCGGTYANGTLLPQTVTFRVVFGVTNMYADATLALPLSAVVRAWRVEAYMTSRSTSVQELLGIIAASSSMAATTGTGGMGAIAPVVAPIQGVSAQNTGSAGSTAISLTVQHSAANAALTLTRRTALLERL